MPAANLTQAAGQAYTKLNTQWLVGHLASHLAAFCATSLPVCPDQNPGSRPVANWLTIIDAFALSDPDDAVPLLTQLGTAAQYMYKCLWLAAELEQQGLVSSAQATALLAAFNAQFP